jgi:hypothetical protein
MLNRLLRGGQQLPHMLKRHRRQDFTVVLQGPGARHGGAAWGLGLGSLGLDPSIKQEPRREGGHKATRAKRSPCDPYADPTNIVLAVQADRTHS